MRRNMYARVLMLLMVSLSLLATPVGMTRALAQNGGLQGDDSYESPQFGYTVTWGEDWRARARDVISNPGGYDTLTLRSDLGNLWIQGQGDSESAASAVERRISIEGKPDDVVSLDLESDVPSAEMLVGRDKVLIEGYSLPDTDAVVVIVLSARERNFEDALASVHEQVLFNDSQVLTGSVVAGAAETDEPTDLTTAEATEEPTDAAVTETEEPTDVAEEPTEEATEEATATQEEEVVETSIENGLFTSRMYDYTVEFDEDIWVVEEELGTESVDGMRLSSDLGALTIWSWDAYGADAAGCLSGETEYYSSEDSSVVDWAQAEDENGDPLEGDGNGYAWGIFELTYANEDGEELDLVEYIECREIPADDAVVIIFASSTPDLFGDHLDQVLDVVDTIEIEGERLVDEPADEPQEPEQTPEPEETREPQEPAQRDDVETGLSGSLFTSPAYGFTVDIPSQWRIEDEQLSDDNETLILSNGVSDVTLWATDDYTGDLAGCVDFAAAESGLDLELDVNSDGEPFRGEGRLEAYGNFRYIGSDDVDMTYFISCRHIVEGESVLILVQDVPFSEFANQRKFRAELEDSIVLPE